MVLLLLAPTIPVPATAGMQIQGPVCGRPVCTGRNGPRAARSALPDGEGGWLVITSDPQADPTNASDGSTDTGILRLDATLASVPVNDGPGGDDPCGALLVGGTGTQAPEGVLALGDGRYLMAGQELVSGPPPAQVAFAWGFDVAGHSTFADPYIAAAPFDVWTNDPRIAPDGRGGFYFAWTQYPAPLVVPFDVFVMRFDREGRAVWPAPIPLSPGSTAWWLEKIAPDLTGGIWIAWVDVQLGPANAPKRFLQHLRDDGAPSLPVGGLALHGDDRFDGLGIALLAVPGGVLVASAKAGISVQLIGEAGQRFWGANGRTFHPVTNAHVPSDIRLLGAPDGSFRIVWNEPGDSEGGGVAAVRIEIDGTSPWPSPVSLLQGQQLLNYDATLLANGNLAVVASINSPWPDPTGFDLKTQALDARGRLKTVAEGAVACAADGNEEVPRILPGDDDRLRFIWSDNRSGYGVSGGLNYFVSAVTFTSNPRLQPVAAPPVILQGGTTTMVLEGDDLDPLASVLSGEGIEVVAAAIAPLSANGPGDRLTLTIRAEPAAAVGTRALTVRNPDGESASLASYLRVSLDAHRIDIDGSGRTDGFDLAVLASSFGRARGEPAYKPGADIDGSGLVDGVDLALLAGRFGGPPIDPESAAAATSKVTDAQNDSHSAPAPAAAWSM